MSIQFSVTHNKPLAQVFPATSFGSNTEQSSGHYITFCTIRILHYCRHCKCKCTDDVLHTSSVNTHQYCFYRHFKSSRLSVYFYFCIVSILLVVGKLFNVYCTLTVFKTLLSLHVLTAFTCTMYFTTDHHLPTSDTPHCLFPLFLCSGLKTARS